MFTSDATQRFYEAVWPHRSAVLRAALIQTGNLAEAEDLAQETFLKAFRAIHTYRPGSSARAWLLTILRNARIDRVRTASGAARNISLQDLASEPPDRDSNSPAQTNSNWTRPEELLDGFSDEAIIAALQSVAEEMRWTLLLVDVEGLDQNEAAKILGVPVGTIKSRVHRGRELLRQRLLSLARERGLAREITMKASGPRSVL